MERVSRRRGVRCLLIAVALVSVLAGCGNDDGDREAFCALLRDGVGIGSPEAAVRPEDYDRLREFAPVEIAPSVRQLQNTARSISEIDRTDLGALFAARFSTESEAARGALLTYGTEECGIEGLSTGEITTDIQLASDLQTYVGENFRNDPWTQVVDYNVVAAAEGAVDIDIEFRTDPAAGLAIDACNAVAVFLYRVIEREGSVAVRDPDGTLLAERASAEEDCITR
jgi:hypothetical protein